MRRLVKAPPNNKRGSCFSAEALFETPSTTRDTVAMETPARAATCDIVLLIALHVREGQAVAKGAPLLVLEAMKMEHPFTAPMDAVVTRVCVEQGAQVTTGGLLIELSVAP